MHETRSSGFSLNSLLGEMEDSNTKMLNEELVTDSLDGIEQEELPEEPDGNTSELILRSKTSLLEENDLASGFYLLDLKTKAMYSILKRKVTIGCQSDCDLILESATMPHTISRKHAVIEIDEDGCAYITDTSSNGVYFAEIEDGKVSFTRLKKGERVLLEKNRVFKLASKAVKFITP